MYLLNTFESSVFNSYPIKIPWFFPILVEYTLNAGRVETF